MTAGKRVRVRTTDVGVPVEKKKEVEVRDKYPHGRTPRERYTRDVMGMPAFAAIDPFIILISADNMMGAVPQDDENCAIAKGCKEQLQTPYVSVGRSRTDLALPHPDGVVKPGYGSTKWAVIRFGNSSEARDVIIAADTGELDEAGVVVTLVPSKPSLRPEAKKERNKLFREAKGVDDGRGRSDKGRSADSLTAMGVRLLTGQRKREHE